MLWCILHLSFQDVFARLVEFQIAAQFILQCCFDMLGMGP
jgi:hypothetical protein